MTDDLSLSLDECSHKTGLTSFERQLFLSLSVYDRSDRDRLSLPFFHTKWVSLYLSFLSMYWRRSIHLELCRSVVSISAHSLRVLSPNSHLSIEEGGHSFKVFLSQLLSPDQYQRRTSHLFRSIQRERKKRSKSTTA